MIVYVETNFLLNIGLKQEEHRHAAELLELASKGALEIALPSFSILEAIHTGDGRRRGRKQLADDLRAELIQMKRSPVDAASVRLLDDASGRFTDLSGAMFNELQQTIIEVMQSVRFLALDRAVLDEALKQQRDLSITASDSIIFASILRDIQRPEIRTRKTAFLTSDLDLLKNVSTALERLGSRRFAKCQELLAFVRNADG